ncbi:MAG TPA: hypothetical protein VH598_06590 [Verrucomicrobiae bacterium]|nr:hypothetical protein [Verrucomicrobiae bacterium]
MSNFNYDIANFLERVGDRHPTLLLTLALGCVVTLIVAIINDTLAAKRGTAPEKTLAGKSHS